MNEKKESIYHRSEGRHKASVVEFLIVQLILNPLGIGNVIPPQLILCISHRKQGKHEH